MASVTIDSRNNKIVVKAYAGKDPKTGKQRFLRESFPPGTPSEVYRRAAAELDARARAKRGAGGVETVDDLVAAYISSRADLGCSPSTAATYRCWYGHVSPMIGGMRVDEARSWDVAAALARCIEGHDGVPAISRAYANDIRAVLRMAYAWAIDMGMAHFNPAPSKRFKEGQREKARPLDAGELEALRAWMTAPVEDAGSDPGAWEELCARRAALVALHTGMRAGEVCGLRPRDIGLDRSVVIASSACEKGGLHLKCTKGGRTRKIAVDETCYRALMEVICARREQFGPVGETVFCDALGRLRRPPSISRAFSRACEDLGISGARFHSLRHTHVSYLAAKGVPIKEIAARIGHASASTTEEVYAHVLPARDRAAADAFFEAMGGGIRGGA